MQQKKEPVPDDSDLDRKRRETEALLQSIGISPEPPLGTLERFVFTRASDLTYVGYTMSGVYYSFTSPFVFML